MSAAPATTHPAAVVHIPATAGHFIEYGRCFVEAAQRVYDKVFVLLPQAHAGEAASKVDWYGAEVVAYPPGLPMRGRPPLAYRHLADWLGVRRAARRLGVPDVHMVLTFLDAIFTAFVAIPPPAVVSRVFALTMRADIGQHDPAGGEAGPRLKHALWRYVLRRRMPQVLATNDPCLYEQALARGYARPGRWLLLPDFSNCHSRPPGAPMEPPAETATSGAAGGQGTADPKAADSGAADPGVADPGAADPGAADPGAITCLAIGYLDRRKNLSLLLQAALRCRQQGHPALRVMLVGTLPLDELDAPGRVAFDELQRQRALLVRSGHVPDAIYREAIQRADAVWAVYAGHPYASGVVIDAMAAGRGLIAQPTGVIGYYARRYPRALMLSADADVDTAARVLGEFCLQCRSIREAPAAGSTTAPGIDRPLDRRQYVDRIAAALATL